MGVAMDAKPCLETIRKFHEVVFSDCLGFIALRSYRESSDHDESKKPILEWIKNDESAVQNMYSFAQRANSNGMGCFCIPGTVAEYGKARSPDVAAMQILLTDIDTGDTARKLTNAAKYLPDPTMLVESGGVTPEGHPKLHAYWKFSKPATGDAIFRLIQGRHELAVKIGGDEAFKSAHQPIRIAGSVYHKTQPGKLVAIKEIK